MMHLNGIAEVAWNIAEEAGWHARPTSEDDRIGTNIALIHSEASEALEALRKHGLDYWFEGEDRKPQGIASELADVIIRTAELAYTLGIDLESAVGDKMVYNAKRADVPVRSGGKAF